MQMHIRLLACIVVIGGAFGQAQATVVRFSSSLGNIDVRLYEAATPLTTANFLNYANGGDWVDAFIHRSIPGFVVQGGGFKFHSDAIGLQFVAQDPPILNEPGISNLRGTIAMAKVSGNPDSATNQWFFNLTNNAANLDAQNGGFTAFGRVVGPGMTVVDAIALLPRVNAGSPFETLPVRGFVGGSIKKENLVTFNSILPLDIPAGDYNFDGVADLADLAIWNADRLSTVKAEADGNGNGIVDDADLVIWQQSSGMVPEPAGASLMSVGFACLAWRRRVGTIS